MLFPVLRRVDEVLAIGYLIVRGAVETACYVALAVGWLLLAPLGEVMSAGPGRASPAGVRLGSLMIESDSPPLSKGQRLSARSAGQVDPRHSLDAPRQYGLPAYGPAPTFSRCGRWMTQETGIPIRQHVLSRSSERLPRGIV